MNKSSVHLQPHACIINTGIKIEMECCEAATFGFVFCTTDVVYSSYAPMDCCI
ncbi:hypothetical protein Hanom_Chr10g00902281 [Helianthus anomalus]